MINCSQMCVWYMLILIWIYPTIMWNHSMIHCLKFTCLAIDGTTNICHCCMLLRICADYYYSLFSLKIKCDGCKLIVFVVWFCCYYIILYIVYINCCYDCVMLLCYYDYTIWFINMIWYDCWKWLNLILIIITYKEISSNSVVTKIYLLYLVIYWLSHSQCIVTILNIWFNYFVTNFDFTCYWLWYDYNCDCTIRCSIWNVWFEMCDLGFDTKIFLLISMLLECNVPSLLNTMQRFLHEEQDKEQDSGRASMMMI